MISVDSSELMEFCVRCKISSDLYVSADGCTTTYLLVATDGTGALMLIDVMSAAVG